MVHDPTGIGREITDSRIERQLKTTLKEVEKFLEPFAEHQIEQGQVLIVNRFGEFDARYRFLRNLADKAYERATKPRWSSRAKGVMERHIGDFVEGLNHTMAGGPRVDAARQHGLLSCLLLKCACPIVSDAIDRARTLLDLTWNVVFTLRHGRVSGGRMGSYCSIYFDEFDICGAKSAVPDAFCAIFQESDRLVRKSRDDENDLDIVYETTRDIVVARLNLLGCTAAVAKERLAAWLQSERATWDEYSADDGDWAAETAQALREFSPEEWYARVLEVLATQYDREESVDVIDRNMRDHNDSWLWFDGYGSLIGLRALLDACPDVKVVTLDITALIGGGWLDQDAKVCEARRESDVLELRPLAPTVILGEGSSDIRVLQRSLAVLFPERQDYFSFFNHVELSVDGGTAYLVKFLKAFAAARAPFRMVAVFDNDTAGLQAHRQASALRLPDNMIVVRLPDTELAKAYPTVGPQGRHVVDVNGQAAGIELYLGRAALTVNGELRPVRWTGYDQGAKAYQGEVEGKADVERAFLDALATFSEPSAARAAFPELVSVWETIFKTVERSAESAERKFHGRLQSDG